jgi:Flp pilus assembly protein protease CpaA
MYEVVFLWTLALAFIIFAVIQDIRTREIANWLSFSLIIFALGFRLIYSVFESDSFVFFLNGLVGFGIFFAVGNLLYYAKVFAGGDAKLMIALGPVLPVFSDIVANLWLLADFLLIFLIAGFVYVLLSSAFLCIKHFKKFRKEFVKQVKAFRRLLIFAIFASLILLIVGFLEMLFVAFGLLAFFTAWLFIYSKAIEEACLVKTVKAEDLREGDWIYADIKLKNRTIKSSWEGTTKAEIALIRKNRETVRVKEGVPFSPVFLISLAVFVCYIF